MVGNEWDDILYWEDYAPFAQFQHELDLKYDLNNPVEYEKRQAERNSFYRSTIPTKEEFIKRFERYTLLGKAQARNLMQQVRLYADFDQLDSLVKERGFVQTDYVPFERWYVVEYHKT